MKAKLVSYTLEKAELHNRVAIQRALYGYNDVSNNGSYQYRRRGLIDLLSGRKLNRGVFIIPNEHINRVLSILKKNKATIETIPITV